MGGEQRSYFFSHIFQKQFTAEKKIQLKMKVVYIFYKWIPMHICHGFRGVRYLKSTIFENNHFHLTLLSKSKDRFSEKL